MTEFERLKAQKERILASQNNRDERCRETVKWILSQSNQFFAECSLAEEIILRCKESLKMSDATCPKCGSRNKGAFGQIMEPKHGAGTWPKNCDHVWHTDD